MICISNGATVRERGDRCISSVMEQRGERGRHMIYISNGATERKGGGGGGR